MGTCGAIMVSSGTWFVSSMSTARENKSKKATSAE